jgi:hypothetical protein
MTGVGSRNMGVRICVLGALEAELNDRGDRKPIDLGWRRQRSLLALLVIAGGEVLSHQRRSTS